MLTIFFWRSTFEFLSFLKWLGFRGKPVSYFAYGGNLDPQVLKSRNIQPIDCRPYTLKDFELRFDHKIPMEGVGMGTIAPHKGKEVPGAIYTLRQIDLWRLDCWECYFIFRRYLRHSFHEGSQLVHYYVSNRVAAGLKPTQAYLEKISRGYQIIYGESFYYRQVLKSIPSIDTMTPARNAYFILNNYHILGTTIAPLLRAYDWACVQIFVKLIYRPAFFDPKDR